MSPPSPVRRGADDEFEQERLQMVDSQLERREIHDRRVLEAMRRVPRHEFVEPAARRFAYEDRPLEIGQGQTISQPFTVAFMAQALQLDGNEKVLEVGTGSGYGAAVLAEIAREVHSVERLPELAEIARERLDRLGYQNVHVHHSNGTLGLPEHAPFDAIVVTAGARQLPEPYFEQLADGGRLVIPIGETPHQQAMYRYTRHGDQRQEKYLGAFAFVPLVGEHSW